VTSREAVESVTHDFIALLKESNLKEMDPSDNTIAVMERYLSELESSSILTDLEIEPMSPHEYATRSKNLFQCQTGTALSAGGLLNVYGSTNVTTYGDANIVSIGLPQNLNITGSLFLPGLTGPGAVTISATGQLDSAKATANGQLLLGVSGALPFFTGLSSPANPSGAASVLYASGANFLSLQAVPLFANVIRVDWLNGNNATATVTNGLPYQTISAALTAAGAAASSVSPYVIWIMPGIYNETLTMQQYVSVIGMSQGAGSTVTSGGSIPTTVGVGGVIIQQLAVTTNTTMVTMAENSQLNNVILNMTTATNGLTLNGISFSGTMATTARVENVNLDIMSTATTGTVSGVISTSTGTPGPEITALYASVISVSTGALTSGNGNTYGINISSGSGTFNVDNCNISATTTSGTQACYGIINSASTTANLAYSTLSGTGTSSADLNNASTGQIVLTATRLVNHTAATATTQNFTSAISPSIPVWSVNSGTAFTAATRFLSFGTLTANPAAANAEAPTQFPVPQPCTIKSLRVSCTTAPGVGNTSTFTLRKSTGGVTSNTSLVAALTGAATTGQDLIHAVSFTGGDLVSMQLVTVGAAMVNPLAAVELY
jgi:hypothetical protein